jgi:DNA-binding transcriptional LysR family regulator|tara:strand:+ start:6701 stop:7630 length:930 start_codon:yes stop_codon:yes gene_type:complete
MNYTLNQLHIFLKVTQNGSVTKAAEELHLTQPAVSIQLKNFQDQFELPLTEVIGRKLYITDFGKEIALATEQILKQVEEINYKTRAFKGQISGRLRISIVSTGKYVMPYFLTDFLKLHTGIDLELDVTNKNKVTKSIEQNQVDFSLVSILPAGLNIESLDLIPNKLYLMGPSNKNGKPRNSKNPEKVLSEIPLVFREVGSGTRQTMNQFIDKFNIDLIKKLELTSNEAVKQAVMAGMGYSIMPIIGTKNELKSGDLEIIPVNGLPIVTTWSLIWPKGKKHSQAAQAYLEYLRTEKSNLEEKYFSWNHNY